MKAAKDSGEEHYDPDRKDDILERNKTRLELWEEHLKDPIVALGKALRCVENSCWRVFGPRIFWRERSPIVGVGFLQSLWKKPIWEGVWPYLDPMDSVCLRTASVEWKVPGKYEPHGELFSFLIQKEPRYRRLVRLSAPSSMQASAPPFSLLKSSRKCALIALHIIAEEGEGGQDGCHALIWEPMESGLYKKSNVGK